jgi:hypothetical protein
MRLVRNILVFFIALVVGFVIFMPKMSLYYFLEQKLAQKGIVIYNEKAKSSLGKFSLSHANISFQGADIAEVSYLEIKPLLVYNSIEAKDIELTGMAKQFLNISIDSLKAKHTLLKPYIVKIDANGTFGSALGYANLKERIIHIDIVDKKNISSVKRFLKRGEKGWYYESKF